MKRSLLLLFFAFAFYPCLAQEGDDYEETSYCKDDIDKKARSYYEKARDKKKYKKPERIEFLTKALEIDPDFAEAHLRMGFEMEVRLRLDEKPYKPLIQPFTAAIKNCPQIHSDPYYFIGFAYYEMLQNDSAKRYLDLFLNFKDDNAAKYSKNYKMYVNNSKGMLQTIKGEAKLKKGVPFAPKVVGGVSSMYDEYLTYISPDGKKCFFTRKAPYQDKNQVYQTDKEKESFMISERDANGNFDAGKKMEEPFNLTNDNQGGCTISLDNKHLIFAMMKDEGGMQPNVDLYITHADAEGYWGEITKLSPNVNDPKYWDSQPTLAADGKTLIFASDRPGGYGGIDLWMTVKDLKTGIWSVPKNLGPTINTSQSEKTPFIHSDSHTLYFCSNGLNGFGDYDIFYSKADEKGNWGEPVNIGSPINGPTEDVGLFLSKDEKNAYFFSYNEGKVAGKGIGRYDMYTFELYPEAQPNAVGFVTGSIKDEKGEAVADAIVEIKNTVTNEKINAVVDSASGTWIAAISLAKKENIVITIKKDSVAFNSKVVDIKNLTAQSAPINIPIAVMKAEKDKSYIINDIHYETNSADIEQRSKLILQSFAEYLVENPNLYVEIQGHTDNKGNPKDNLALSTDRAYSVKSYLENFKVNGKRITAKGYGQEKPLADNGTEAGRAQNRRTEFLIVEH
jgi:outer membrane protein OmpA-like peptidoglycan-associated protein